MVEVGTCWEEEVLVPTVHVVVVAVEKYAGKRKKNRKRTHLARRWLSAQSSRGSSALGGLQGARSGPCAPLSSSSMGRWSWLAVGGGGGGSLSPKEVVALLRGRRRRKREERRRCRRWKGGGGGGWSRCWEVAGGATRVVVTVNRNDE
jgi:hypothetical protein